MSRCLVARCEDAGALKHHVNFEITPRQVFWITLSKNRDAITIDVECAILDRNGGTKATMRRIELKEVCVDFGSSQVVNGDNTKP